MEITSSCPLAAQLAARIREERKTLTRRWLDRIVARVSLDPNRVFPSDQLLDHVPILMEGIADYIQDPADEISAHVPVIAKAMELGALRLQQGFDAHEIMKEYEILGGVLYNFAAREVETLDAECSQGELMIFAHRLFRAISVIEQATTSHYLRVMNERVNQREQQLRRFNRMVSHELKNKVGAVLGAGELIGEEWLPEAERRKFVEIVLANARDLQMVLENLTELSRMDADVRRQRNVMLKEAVAEVIRQQRESIRARNINVQVAELPGVEVNAAVVELSLANFLSNAIKYSRRDGETRWVRIEAAVEGADGQGAFEVTVRVSDNGVGVPEAERDKLFKRFFRAETAVQEEGTGLGLSLVRETIEAIGGRAWAEFTEGVTVFAFALPCRRRGENVTQPPKPEEASQAAD